MSGVYYMQYDCLLALTCHPVLCQRSFSCHLYEGGRMWEFIAAHMLLCKQRQIMQGMRYRLSFIRRMCWPKEPVY